MQVFTFFAAELQYKSSLLIVIREYCTMYRSKMLDFWLKVRSTQECPVILKKVVTCLLLLSPSLLPDNTDCTRSRTHLRSCISQQPAVKTYFLCCFAFGIPNIIIILLLIYGWPTHVLKRKQVYRKLQKRKALTAVRNGRLKQQHDKNETD